MFWHVSCTCVASLFVVLFSHHPSRPAGLFAPPPCLTPSRRLAASIPCEPKLLLAKLSATPFWERRRPETPSPSLPVRLAARRVGARPALPARACHYRPRPLPPLPPPLVQETPHRPRSHHDCPSLARPGQTQNFIAAWADSVRRHRDPSRPTEPGDIATRGHLASARFLFRAQLPSAPPCPSSRAAPASAPVCAASESPFAERGLARRASSREPGGSHVVRRTGSAMHDGWSALPDGLAMTVRGGTARAAAGRPATGGKGRVAEQPATWVRPKTPRDTSGGQ